MLWPQFLIKSCSSFKTSSHVTTSVKLLWPADLVGSLFHSNVHSSQNVLNVFSYNYLYRRLPPSPKTVSSSMSRILGSSRVHLNSLILKLNDFGSNPIPTTILSSYLPFSKLFNLSTCPFTHWEKNEDNCIYLRIVMKSKWNNPWRVASRLTHSAYPLNVSYYCWFIFIS